MGREFAQVHPSTAGLLAEKGSDPDVERLLEGFAFLSARIRERVDDAVPDVVHGLMQLLMPHYLRPVPSVTLVQFEPSLKAVRGVHQVDRGHRLSSKPVEGTACEFRTTQDVELLPLRVDSVELDETVSAHPTIRLRFETNEAGRGVVLRKEGIRLLLYGELGLCSTLYLWFMRHLESVVVRTPEGEETVIGSDVVRPVGFRREDAMIPWPRLAQEGYRYLQELFTLPHKFLFIDVVDLHRATIETDDFEIAFRFNRPPDLKQRLTAENFRLFCTPAINLFETTGEPVKRDPRVHEHLLRASGLRPTHAEVYDVRSVLGLRQGRSERRTYRPFAGFEHAADAREGSYYTLRPTISPLDNGIDTYLSIVTPLDNSPVRDEEVLSFELTCSNRSLPAELQLGEVNVAPRGSSAPAKFRNIAPVTVPVRPRLGSELLWRLLSHMAIARSSLADPEVLRSLLSLYNFQRDVSPTVGRANDLKIESIRSVETDATTRLMGGAPVRGVEVSIEVEEAKFGSIGEAFLFGCVLDEVFASHVPLNSFNELRLILHPSKGEFRWPARSGQRRIL
jgi:type VI secretion system protein ImpG